MGNTNVKGAKYEFPTMSLRKYQKTNEIVDIRTIKKSRSSNNLSYSRDMLTASTPSSSFPYGVGTQNNYVHDRDVNYAIYKGNCVKLFHVPSPSSPSILKSSFRSSDMSDTESQASSLYNLGIEPNIQHISFSSEESEMSHAEMSTLSPILPKRIHQEDVMGGSKLFLDESFGLNNDTKEKIDKTCHEDENPSYDGLCSIDDRNENFEKFLTLQKEVKPYQIHSPPQKGIYTSLPDSSSMDIFDQLMHQCVDETRNNPDAQTVHSTKDSSEMQNKCKQLHKSFDMSNLSLELIPKMNDHDDEGRTLIRYRYIKKHQPELFIPSTKKASTPPEILSLSYHLSNELVNTKNIRNVHVLNPQTINEKYITFRKSRLDYESHNTQEKCKEKGHLNEQKNEAKLDVSFHITQQGKSSTYSPNLVRSFDAHLSPTCSQEQKKNYSQSPSTQDERILKQITVKANKRIRKSLGRIQPQIVKQRVLEIQNRIKEGESKKKTLPYTKTKHTKMKRLEKPFISCMKPVKEIDSSCMNGISCTTSHIKETNKDISTRLMSREKIVLTNFDGNDEIAFSSSTYVPSELYCIPPSNSDISSLLTSCPSENQRKI